MNKPSERSIRTGIICLVAAIAIWGLGVMVFGLVAVQRCCG